MLMTTSRWLDETKKIGQTITRLLSARKLSIQSVLSALRVRLNRIKVYAVVDVFNTQSETPHKNDGKLRSERHLQFQWVSNISLSITIFSFRPTHGSFSELRRKKTFFVVQANNTKQYSESSAFLGGYGVNHIIPICSYLSETIRSSKRWRRVSEKSSFYPTGKRSNVFVNHLTVQEPLYSTTTTPRVSRHVARLLLSCYFFIWVLMMSDKDKRHNIIPSFHLLSSHDSTVMKESVVIAAFWHYRWISLKDLE